MGGEVRKWRGQIVWRVLWATAKVLAFTRSEGLSRGNTGPDSDCLQGRSDCALDSLWGAGSPGRRPLQWSRWEMRVDDERYCLLRDQR